MQVRQNTSFIQSFGGLNFIHDILSKTTLSALVEACLGQRGRTSTYSYSGILRQLLYTASIGGEVLDDNTTLKEQLQDHPELKIASPGTIEYCFKGLQQASNIRTATSGAVHQYSTYQWLLNGDAIQDATDPTYTITQNGNYQVAVTDEEGCADTSEVYEVTNIDELDISQKGTQQKIKIYPNPTNNTVNVHMNAKVDLTLRNPEGRTLKQTKKENQLFISELPDGLYFLEIHDRQGRLLKVEKIIKSSN